MTEPRPAEESAQGYFQFERPEVQELVPAAARRILDVGCAAGRLGAGLKRRGEDVEVWGMELDPEAAAEARQRLDRVLEGDLERCIGDLPRGYFDCIILADVLEHLANPERVLPRLVPCLAPGGVFVASIPNVRHWSVIKDLIEGRWEYTDAGLLDRTHLRFFTRLSIEEFFATADCRVGRWAAVSMGGQLAPPVIEALAGFGLDTSTLAEESEVYQYLVVAEPLPGPAASIVILTWNELPYTKRCVASLLRHTPESHELIFVDNGSTDGTPDYLRTIPGARVIANPTNLGFAAGCNQGMAAATGRHVVLLNNDAVVSEDWLSGLLEPCQRDPRVGLVGPRSNYVVGPQLIERVPYDQESLVGLDEFARERARRFAGKGFALDRAIGFCLLVRRAVVERIGGLDTRFGSGNFEDDDLCLRARLAGFKIWIADDVFVHHFGSRTFIGARIDYTATMERNWAKFRAKWLLPPDLPAAGGYVSEQLLKQPFDPRRHVVPLVPPAPGRSEPGYELFNRYLEHYGRHDYPEAVAVGRQILEDVERTDSLYRDDEILFFLGSGFASTGEYEDAQRCYQAAFALGRQRAERAAGGELAAREEQRFRQLAGLLTNNLAVLEYAQGRFAEAERLLASAAEVVAAGNDSVLGRNRQAMAERRVVLYLQEIQGQDRPLPLRVLPLVERWRTEGLAALEQGRPEAARTCFQAVCSALGAGPQDWHDLGMSLSQLGRHPDALSVFVRALQLDPSLPVSYMNVGYALFNLGDGYTAEQFLLKAQAFDPALPHLADNLADVRRRKAELSQAAPAPEYEPLLPLLALRRSARLSVCLIVRDEEQRLPACLASAQPVADEIVVVDTGSTDGTVAIAERFGARVFHCAWNQDFSAARNESLRHATGDWVLVLDADEQLDPDSYSVLRALIARTAVDPDHPTVFVPRIVSHLNQPGEYSDSYMPRLLPRVPGLVFRGRLHEHPTGPRIKYERVRQIVIHHEGYRPDVISQRRKWARNLELSRQMVEEQADDHYYRYILGNQYLMVGDWQKARVEYERSLALGREQGATLEEQYYLPDCCYGLSLCHLELGAPEPALAFARQGLDAQADHPGLLVLQGQALHRLGRYQEAIASFRGALALRGQSLSTYSNVASGHVSWIPWMGIGDAYAALDDVSRAREAYEEALKIAPEYTPLQQRAAALDQRGVQAQEVLEWRIQGAQAYEAGMLPSALGWFRRVAGTPWAGPRDYHNLGAAWYQSGDYGSALDAYGQAVAAAPQYAPSFNYVGTALYQLGDLLTARRFFARARELNPFLRDAGENEVAVAEQIAAGDAGALAARATEYAALLPLLEGTPRPRLSLCMIVKNEEPTLLHCLTSAQAVVDEMVVVDTGSTDGTVAIAERFGARVFHCAWTQDFSAARNESLRHATGDWILVLDADEQLTQESYAPLLNLIALSAATFDGPVAYHCRIVNTSPSGEAEFYNARLLPNLPGLCFRGRIHEQPSLPGLRSQFARDVTILHSGYEEVHMKRQGKQQRNLELLERAVAEDPNDAFHRYNLGIQYAIASEFERAVEQLERAIAWAVQEEKTHLLWIEDAYDSVAKSLIHMGRVDEALTYCDKALSFAPNNASLWVRAGEIYLQKGEFDMALAYFQKARTIEGLASGVGITYLCDATWVPLYGMGLVYARRGQVPQARQCFEQALALSPGHPAIQTQLDRLPKADTAAS